jgi:isopenicillin N synthase-like dioxygenase
MKQPAPFDPFKKERELRSDSSSWDTSNPEEAQPGDIPVIDLGEYFQSGSLQSLKEAANQVRTACEQTGFFSIVNHGISSAEMHEMFSMVRRFHSLPTEEKWL